MKKICLSLLYTFIFIFVLISCKDKNDKIKQYAFFDENEFLESIGCEKTNSSTFAPFVSKICKSIVNGNTEEFSQLIGATSNDYSFLENIKIEHYSMCSFYPTETTLNNTDNHINGNEFYLVKFKVVESEIKEIPVGDNAFVFLPYDEAYSRCLISSVEDAKKHLFTPLSNSTLDEYENYFVDEFLCEYADALNDGLNYASSFDMEKAVHLITHLMSRSNRYRNCPPYSANEINEFIHTAFNGNPGVDFSFEYFENMWLHNTYATTDYNCKYGCSFAHGGSVLEYEIINTSVKDGITTLEIQTFSDFSRINKAYKLFLNIKFEENQIPVMISAEVVENTGRDVAKIIL